MISSATACISRRTIAGLFAFLFLWLSGSRGADFAIVLTGDSVAWPTVVAPGGTATFNVSTAPTVAGSYQWYFNDTAIAQATDATLILAGLAPSQTGNYRLQCSPASGPVEWSNTLTLNVISPPSPVDTSFTAAANVDHPIAVLANGSILVEVLGGGLARLHADGSLDPTFTYPESAGGIMAVFPDGAMLTTKPPYRLNADGSPAAFTFPVALDSSQPFMVGVQSGGRFLLAQGTTLLRFNADGTPDPTFTYTPPQIVTISSITVDFKDRTIVQGIYRQVPPTDVGGLNYSVFRLSPTGAVDPAFPGGTSSTRGDGGAVSYYFPFASGYLVELISWGAGVLIHINDEGVPDPGGAFISFSGTYIPLEVDPAGRIFLISDAYQGSTRHQTISAYNVTSTSVAIDLAFNPGQPAGAIDPTTGNSTYLLGRMLLQPDGQLLVSGLFTSWDGHATTNLARLRSADAPVTPVVRAGYSGNAPHAGFVYTLTSSGGGGSTAYTYQWLALDGQRLPANSTSDTLVFPAFAGDQLGRYQLRVTGPTGATLSNVVELSSMTESPPRLVNLSGRAVAGDGENTLIAGCVTSDPYGADLLLRGAGPALQPFGIANFLPDPVITVANATGALLAQNDNWGDDAPSNLSAFASRTGAFAFVTGSLDAAMLTRLYQGPNTVQLFDRTGRSGVGLVEIYEDSTETTDALINLSFRAHTAPGEATAIAGFVINDPEGLGRSARILLRVVGPTLATQGIQHPLADPVLTLFNAKGEVLKRVDNWSDDPDLAILKATMKQVGAFDLPAGSKDAAVVLDLPAGVYTMSATGADAGSGVALLEIYLVR